MWCNTGWEIQGRWECVLWLICQLLSCLFSNLFIDFILLILSFATFVGGMMDLFRTWISLMCLWLGAWLSVSSALALEMLRCGRPSVYVFSYQDVIHIYIYIYLCVCALVNYGFTDWCCIFFVIHRGQICTYVMADMLSLFCPFCNCVYSANTSVRPVLVFMQINCSNCSNCSKHRQRSYWSYCPVL